MPDPTSLLDALQFLITSVAEQKLDPHSRIGAAFRYVHPDAVARLRAMVRSEAETEVLRAAITLTTARSAWLRSRGFSAYEAEREYENANDELSTRVALLPPDELARLGGAK